MVSSSYISKPFLFGGDGKISNFTSSKFVGMLDNLRRRREKPKKNMKGNQSILNPCAMKNYSILVPYCNFSHSFGSVPTYCLI